MAFIQVREQSFQYLTGFLCPHIEQFVGGYSSVSMNRAAYRLIFVFSTQITLLCGYFYSLLSYASRKGSNRIHHRRSMTVCQFRWCGQAWRSSLRRRGLFKYFQVSFLHGVEFAPQAHCKHPSPDSHPQTATCPCWLWSLRGHSHHNDKGQIKFRLTSSQLHGLTSIFWRG